MQGLQPIVLAAMLLAWSGSHAWAQDIRPESYGFAEPSSPQATIVAERVKGRLRLSTSGSPDFPQREINVPGASFIKLHFSQFRLPKGVTVEISNADGSEQWSYSSDEKDPLTMDAGLGDDGVHRFSAMSVTGDTAILRVTGDLFRFDPTRHQVEIDSWLQGLSAFDARVISDRRKKDGNGGSHIESNCGADERYDSICWASSNSWEYNRSAAVALLMNSKGQVCTAWRVGSDNHLFTAEHCLGSQSELDGAEIWFDYQATSCGGSGTTNAVKVSGGNLIAKDGTLDYSLFSVNGFSKVSHFPAFGLKVSDPSVGEPIFIPQYGWGAPMQIALESDMNSSGLCEVDSTDEDGYFPGSDIGYYCDTTTSSSGSPVVSNVSGDVVALHHAGGCLNLGVKMSNIWPDVKSAFGGQIPRGNSGGSGGGGSTGGDNQAPSAEFSIQCGDLDCSFDGSLSTDPDGTVDSYSWDLGDGGSASGAQVSHTYSASGTFDVTLTVQDDSGDSDSISYAVTVTAPNSRPQASFSTTCINNSCDFDASGSHDPDGYIASTHWDFGDGSKDSGTSASHVYQQAGTYNVRLTVTDDQGKSDTIGRLTTVTLANQKPSASFSATCNDLSCAFDASASFDADGSIASWKWYFGDGSSASGEKTSYRFGAAGTFPVTLDVTDDRGAVSSSLQSITVTVANSAPSAGFSYRCTDLNCTFDASASTDPDGSITSWNWDFGDGSGSSGAQASHAFSREGAYAVSLTVADNLGATDTTLRTVQVSLSNTAPQAGFSFDCSALDCVFDASASSDSDGSIVSWNWDFGDGSSGTGSKAGHRFAGEGKYTVQLAVTDDQGAVGQISRTVDIRTESPDPEPGPEPNPDTNLAPRAEFSYRCDGETCYFDASGSNDPDGTLKVWNWTFGDGQVASGRQVSHHFGSPGKYAVSLTVEDNDGDRHGTTRTVEVTGDQPEIKLTGQGSRKNSRTVATLRWTGAETATVELFRDGDLLTTTRNDGKLIDTSLDGQAKSASYRLCQPASAVCSKTLVLYFASNKD